MLMRFTPKKDMQLTKEDIEETTEDLCEEKIVNVEYDGDGCFTAYFAPDDKGVTYYFTFYKDEWDLLRNPINASKEEIPTTEEDRLPYIPDEPRD